MKLKLGSPTLLLSIASLVLAVQVVVLSIENRRLKEDFAVHAAEPAEPHERPRFAVGDFLEPFDVVDAGGVRHRIGFDGGFERLLVFVFARGCTVCPFVLPEWNDLALSVPPSVSVLGVQLDALGTESDDPAWKDLRFEPRALADPTQVPFDKLTAVPLTMLVDAAGLVQWVRYGLPDENERAELRRLLAGD
jgi:hypothetical protein